MQKLPMKFHGGLLLIIATVFLAAGCQTRQVLRNQVNSKKLEAVKTVALDVQTISNAFNVDYLPSQLNLTVPVAAVTGAQIAAATTDRETAAAAGIVGTFIGIQIAKSVHQNKLQTAANKQVSALKRDLEAERFHHRISEVFGNALRADLSERYEFVQGNNPDAARILVKLSASLSADITSIHLRAELAISNKDNASATPIYAREIDYFDTPIGNPHIETADDLSARWMHGDAAFFWERMDASLGALAGIIADDLVRIRKFNGTNGVAIRYGNVRGTFYERGNVVEAKGDRLLVRTLRGGLVSVPGTLLANKNAAPD